MATFLHRLCLFGLLATTGFAMSNCQRQAEERNAMMEDPAAEELVAPVTRVDDPPADTLGIGGSGLGDSSQGMDAGTRRMDAGTRTLDAGTRSMDAGTR